MKQTSKNFYNALESVYREIKYDNPENTGYPFDMVHDTMYIEEYNPEYFAVFIKADYFSTYTLKFMDKDDISEFSYFDKDLTSFRYIVIKYYDQILTYTIKKDTVEYISKILRTLYDLSYDNMRHNNPEKIKDYPYNENMFQRDYKQHYEWCDPYHGSQ